MKTRITIIWFLALLPFCSLRGQERLTLSLLDAERLFLERNAQLLAQRYQVEQSRADIITAKLFENPEISYENLLYNHESGRFLETSYATGQYAASITHLFKLAGKRNKDIQAAQTATKMEDYAYFDLIRTLKYELRSTYFRAFYLERSSAVYDQLIRSLRKLLDASEQQLKLGNTSTKEVVRIKSRLYSLMAEYASVQNELTALKGQLKLLSSINADTEIAFTGAGIDPSQFNPQAFTFGLLLDSAKTNRADLMLTKTGLTYAQHMLAVQKARAVPDVQISLSYDLKGNYPEKYTGLGLSIPIPLFDRNQGEIKKARIAIEASNNEIHRKELEVETALHSSYQSAIKITQLYSGLDKDFALSFNQLMEAVLKNYQERNISLIEFLDFYDAFKENAIQLNDIEFQVMNAREDINYQTGTNIFK